MCYCEWDGKGGEKLSGGGGGGKTSGILGGKEFFPGGIWGRRVQLSKRDCAKGYNGEEAWSMSTNTDEK